jgi:outer membrane protein
MRAGSSALLFLLLLAAVGGEKSFPQSLTLQDCLEQGLKNSKTLHAAELRLEALEAGYQEARSARLPSLGLGASYSRLSPLAAATVTLPAPVGAVTLFPAIEDSVALSASLRQPLWSGLRIRSAIAQARAAREEGAMSLRQQRAELAYRIQAAFWELAEAGESLKVIRENIARVNEHLKEIQDFYDRGLVTHDQVLRARMQLSQSALRELEAVNDQALLRARLAVLIGLPAESDVTLEYSLEEEEGQLQGGAEPGASGGSSETAGPSPALQAAEPGASAARAGSAAAADALAEDAVAAEARAALQRRPEVGAARQRVAAAQAAVAAALSGWYPSVFLTGGYQYALPNPRQFPPEPVFTPTWDLGIAASVDVGRWPSVAHRAAQARALEGQAREALGQLQDSITLEVIQARLEENKNEERIRVARRLVEQAEEGRRIVADRYRNGLALTSELLDAETSLLEGDLELARARIDLRIARAALARALGQ